MEASCYCPTIREISQSQAKQPLESLTSEIRMPKKTYWSATAAYDPVCRVLADRKPFPRKRGNQDWEHPLELKIGLSGFVRSLFTGTR